MIQLVTIPAITIPAIMIPAVMIEAAGIQAAGIQAAGIQAAGIQAARIQAARIQAAGIQAAGIQAAGIQVAGIRAARIPAVANPARRIGGSPSLAGWTVPAPWFRHESRGHGVMRRSSAGRGRRAGAPLGAPLAGRVSTTRRRPPEVLRGRAQAARRDFAHGRADTICKRL
ncbi:MAG: hypothetical protein QM674_23645 [Burkholderiaceae bacterium]